MKYQIPYDQNDHLPNRLGLREAEAIAFAEFNGFIQAELLLVEKLTQRTKFTSRYIQTIHKLALGEIYSFAGKWRNVNLSKGGFVFPMAHFLPDIMEHFDQTILMKLPNRYENKAQLIHDLAVVHAELLFIHPFREGNGRTARLLANLMCRKQGLNAPHWEKIEPNENAPIRFTTYVIAVQQAAEQNYKPMKQIIETIFPT
ncbi:MULTISPECIES: Fic family protein [unclassified Spirosoma]|uniref:Fic/DOC family protein n=1 Tax=unclassified Spirosoma TaxID=2621999 RepID=UPI000968C798|nr:MULTISPECIES: Fic family protein [unclassified Spirosoma]MBN8821065.1 Fic family protein [Spirosoma sp.]OJW79295.1 MAG: cell filamentation protein Fic [Spirosoma sp. 48-14]